MDDIARARLAISVLDLTDLSDDASEAGVDALCARAAAAGVAAVCVWPRFVEQCVSRLSDSDVRVATVVNFPTGDDPLDEAVGLTDHALRDGADEIDVVLPWKGWVAGNLAAAGSLLAGVRDASSEHVLKVIIETGSLPDPASIDRAAHFAIGAGADFVKTSTGKTAVSATLEAAEIVLEAIDVSGRRVGLKASGGIRTFEDAVAYLDLADSIMGDGWASPATFRFGASSLLHALEAVVAGESEPVEPTAY